MGNLSAWHWMLFAAVLLIAYGDREKIYELVRVGRELFGSREKFSQSAHDVCRDPLLVTMMVFAVVLLDAAAAVKTSR
jgi:hypothetical protein